MVYGFGIFMALAVGLHGPVAHHASNVWARAVFAVRKYFFDIEELVPTDGVPRGGYSPSKPRSRLIQPPFPPPVPFPTALCPGQSLEDNPRVRELLYELRASGLLRTRRYGVRRFRHCLVGACAARRRAAAALTPALTTALSFRCAGHEMVTWLLATQQAPTRQDAVALGANLLRKGFLQHVTQEHNFSDSELFYKVGLLSGVVWGASRPP